MDFEISISEYMQNKSYDDILVDLRDEISFSHGSIPNAINIPLNKIRELYSLPKDKRIFLFCQRGEFSRQAVQILLDAGYEAYNLNGGYISWLAERVGH